MHKINWEAVGLVATVWLIILVGIAVVVFMMFMITHFPKTSLGLFLFVIIVAISIAMYNDFNNEYDNRGV